MAYFSRRHARYVTVYYYYENKLHTLPREKTRHLDDLNDQQIQDWIDKWEKDHGIKRVRSRLKTVLKADELVALFEQYLEQKRYLRNTNVGVLRRELSHFNKYILPYFVQKHTERDITKWYKHTAGLSVYLKKEVELSNNTTKKIAWMVERFGKYLFAKGIIASVWHVPIPVLGRKASTPLKQELTPDYLLQVASTLDAKWRLVVLLGYFASLRPGETFALQKEDFVTGSKAKELAKTYTRFNKMGIGSGLTVSITKALNSETGEPSLPKTHYSYGFVNIWHIEAAKQLAGLLKQLPTGKLFDGHRRHLFKGYKSLNLPFTLHDLRRASALYLGRTLSVDPLLLQDHLRHSNISTTMIYTRRPTEDVVLASNQDFDDVS